MIEWRPTQYEDLTSLLPRAQVAQQSQIASLPDTPEVRKLLEAQFQTFWLDGQPEALIGFAMLWPGVARGMGLLSEKALTRPVALSRHVLRWLEADYLRMELRRLEVTVDERHPAAHRWAIALGFHPEGRMEQYGPDGACHWLYAKLGG